MEELTDKFGKIMFADQLDEEESAMSDAENTDEAVEEKIKLAA